jgi:hypothetical protein
MAEKPRMPKSVNAPAIVSTGIATVMMARTRLMIFAADGFDVREIGESRRILPHAVVQKFVVRADGEREPLTPGSTRPVTSVVTGAGIARDLRFHFTMP